MIQIIDDYVIDVDENNYTVKIDKHKQTTDKKGNVSNVYTIVGYYNNLKNAIIGIKNDMIRKSLSDGIISLESAIKRIEDISNRLENKLPS